MLQREKAVFGDENTSLLSWEMGSGLPLEK